MCFNVLYIIIFFIPWFNEKKFSTLLRPFGQYLYGFHALDRLLDPALQLLAKWQSLVDSKRYVRFRIFFSKAWLVSLRDLPRMIRGSFSSLKPPLQCPGGFGPLNKVRQREKCRWKIWHTRYAPGSHPRRQFSQQAFLEIEGHYESWPHEKVQSDRSTRFRANPENRPLRPGRTIPPGIMWFRSIGGVFWTPRADLLFSIT